IVSLTDQVLGDGTKTLKGSTGPDGGLLIQAVSARGQRAITIDDHDQAGNHQFLQFTVDRTINSAVNAFMQLYGSSAIMGQIRGLKRIVNAAGGGFEIDFGSITGFGNFQLLHLAPSAARFAIGGILGKSGVSNGITFKGGIAIAGPGLN